MMDSRHDEEENMYALYEASRNGCVSILNTFIQRDARILDRVSLTSFSETPLHIAALHGHFEFSRLLISNKPKLVEEVDSLGRTPLHLASAEGHTEIVKALLEANTDVCLAFDQDEKISLHLAAMRGRIEIIKELIIARRESILVNLNGNSVLHFCVRYNHLDALKLLVESASYCNELLNSKDHDGNSILHLAVMLKQTKKKEEMEEPACFYSNPTKIGKDPDAVLVKIMQKVENEPKTDRLIDTIKYLLSVPKIKREMNAINMIGYTPLDVLEVCPKDFKCFEIQNILKKAGIRKSTDLNSSPSSTLSVVGPNATQPAQSEQQARWWAYFFSLMSLVKHIKYQDNWMEETRGVLMVVATVIASMAFQAGLSPPGGLLQGNTTAGGFDCTQDICKAGKTILAYADADNYLKFLSFNTISFFASLSVLLLVISGFPLTNKLAIWFLTLAMSTAVTFMALTYLWVVLLVTPDYLFHRVCLMNSLIEVIWIVLLVVVGVIHAIRLLSWVINVLPNFKCRSTMGPSRDDPANV